MYFFFPLSQKREKTYVVTLEVYNVKALEVYNVKALEVHDVKALEVFARGGGVYFALCNILIVIWNLPLDSTLI